MSEGRNTASLVSELRDTAPKLEKALRVPEGVTLDESNLMRRAAAALESTSRALSEKEGELRRVQAVALAHIDEMSAFQRQMVVMERQRDEALAALKASEEREAGLRAALGPFAHVAKTESKLIRYSATGWNEADMTADCDRAFSALENGPAGLADATKKDTGTEQREAGR